MDSYRLAGSLADDPAKVGPNRKLVSAVTERHEGTPERVALDGAADLDQPRGAEVLG